MSSTIWLTALKYFCDAAALSAFSPAGVAAAATFASPVFALAITGTTAAGDDGAAIGAGACANVSRRRSESIDRGPRAVIVLPLAAKSHCLISGIAIPRSVMI